MAVTKTDQFHAWPQPNPDAGATWAPHDGDGWLADGQGVHTVFARDLPTQMNNIASYCNPWAQYMQSCLPFSGANGMIGTTVLAAGEYPIFQCPIVVPPGATRLFWTAGVVAQTVATATIESAKVYLSIREYTATAMSATSSPFDATGIYPRRLLFGNYYAAPLSSAAKPVNRSSAGYTFVSDTQSDGGIANFDASCSTVSSGTGTTRLSHLIFTLTASQVGTLIAMGVADFTCWFGYD